ncbi:Carbonic anhydrase 2 [Posidoniimonas polymericola]|uniref:Carbonic anhydrase n=1 Tax=Posidoniimonas polymericola TaxID=2528002 RepID=A0A5C5ZE61_9BACT|nr:carbonate dehydratase [Posidoniimonas polymericola]TWT85357.1 Carbonic anhydrase 2 [Posidoniimonas polymericola]
MRALPELFQKNADWSRKTTEADPAFFDRLSKQQAPKYLWIGCADSRVPANQVVGLDPGELFVHRNVANLVVHSDVNCLSVVQYAVEALKVEHIIVCGHYGCGGVAAALAEQKLGLIENWLRYIQDVRNEHRQHLDSITDPTAKVNRLCELNVIAQVANLCRTTIVRDAWDRAQPLAVHGWIYGLNDGRLRDLGMCVKAACELDERKASSVQLTGGATPIPPSETIA